MAWRGRNEQQSEASKRDPLAAACRIITDVEELCRARFVTFVAFVAHHLVEQR